MNYIRNKERNKKRKWHNYHGSIPKNGLYNLLQNTCNSFKRGFICFILKPTYINYVLYQISKKHHILKNVLFAFV